MRRIHETLLNLHSQKSAFDLLNDLNSISGNRKGSTNKKKKKKRNTLTIKTDEKNKESMHEDEDGTEGKIENNIISNEMKVDDLNTYIIINDSNKIVTINRTMKGNMLSVLSKKRNFYQ